MISPPRSIFEPFVSLLARRAVAVKTIKNVAVRGGVKRCSWGPSIRNYCLLIDSISCCSFFHFLLRALSRIASRMRSSSEDTLPENEEVGARAAIRSPVQSSLPFKRLLASSSDQLLNQFRRLMAGKNANCAGKRAELSASFMDDCPLIPLPDCKPSSSHVHEPMRIEFQTRFSMKWHRLTTLRCSWAE